MQARVEQLERLVAQLQIEVRELRSVLGVEGPSVAAQSGAAQEVSSSGLPSSFAVVSEPASPESRLTPRAAGLETPPSASASTAAPASPSHPLQGLGPASGARLEGVPPLPRTQRDTVCRGINAWLRRCLQGALLDVTNCLRGRDSG